MPTLQTADTDRTGRDGFMIHSCIVVQLRTSMPALTILDIVKSFVKFVVGILN